MQNKKVIILIILGIGAIFSLMYGITAPTKGRRRVISDVGTVRQAEGVQSVSRIVPTKRRAKETEFTFWGRNPFVSQIAPSKARPKLALNGIVWDKKNPKALINDAVLGIGDEIGGNKVVNIKKDRVLLNDGTADFELKLEQ